MDTPWFLYDWVFYLATSTLLTLLKLNIIIFRLSFLYLLCCCSKDPFCLWQSCHWYIIEWYERRKFFSFLGIIIMYSEIIIFLIFKFFSILMFIQLWEEMAMYYFISLTKKKKPWKPCDDLRIKSKILTAIKNLSKKTTAFTNKEWTLRGLSFNYQCMLKQYTYHFNCASIYQDFNSINLFPAICVIITIYILPLHLFRLYVLFSLF